MTPTTHTYWDPTLSITTRKNFFSLISKILPQGKTRVTQEIYMVWPKISLHPRERSVLYYMMTIRTRTTLELNYVTQALVHPPQLKKNYDTPPTLLSPTTRIEVSIFFVPFLHSFHLSALSYYRCWNIQVWATLRIPKVHIPPFNITLQAISTYYSFFDKLSQKINIHSSFKPRTNHAFQALIMSHKILHMHIKWNHHSQIYANGQFVVGSFHSSQNHSNEGINPHHSKINSKIHKMNEFFISSILLYQELCAWYSMPHKIWPLPALSTLVLSLLFIVAYSGLRCMWPKHVSQFYLILFNWCYPTYSQMLSCLTISLLVLAHMYPS